MNKRRGIALLYALGGLGLLVILGSVMLERFDVSLRQADRANARVTAEAAADCGLAEALYGIYENDGWTAGVKGLTSTGAAYEVTFEPGDVPWSTNNAEGSAAAEGEGGRVIPAGFVHVIAVGTYLGVKVQQELMVDVSGTRLAIKERW